MLRSDVDLVASRIRSREVAGSCGFLPQEQVLISGIVAEISRSVFSKSDAAEVRFFLDESVGTPQLAISIFAAVSQPVSGMAAPAKVAMFDNQVLAAGRKFMDTFAVEFKDAGLHIGMAKSLPPKSAISLTEILDKVSDFAALPDNVAMVHARRKSEGLEQLLAAVHAREAELVLVSRRLSATNDEVAELNIRLTRNGEALAATDRRKDEFLSTLSHELRGPLAAAAMGVTLLQTKPGDEKHTMRVSEIINRQIQQMSRLVEDLLDVSRVGQGLLSINQHSLDVRDTISASVEQLGPSIEQKSHRVSVSMPEEPCMIQGDKARLIQVFSNLLSNAVRYTSVGGKINVSLSLQPSVVVVKVTDNGPGIAPSLIPHLFDLYVQAERSSDRLNSGLGLGLPLVKSLVAMHGGTVSALSGGLGHGSTFVVQLPQ